MQLQQTPDHHKQAPYLLWGYVLLVSGFLWALIYCLSFDALMDGKETAAISNTIPQRNIAPDEAADIIHKFAADARVNPLWMLGPAVAMFAGGLLLGRASSQGMMQRSANS